MEVTKKTNIAALTSKHPEAAIIMLDYGLHCVGCAISGFDTIETGAQIHGMSDDEITEMITAIQEAIDSNRNE